MIKNTLHAKVLHENGNDENGLHVKTFYYWLKMNYTLKIYNRVKMNSGLKIYING